MALSPQAIRNLSTQCPHMKGMQSLMVRGGSVGTSQAAPHCAYTQRQHSLDCTQDRAESHSRQDKGMNTLNVGGSCGTEGGNASDWRQKKT